MSSNLDKIGNRFRELGGQPFAKIPQQLVRMEEKLTFIKEELSIARKNNSDPFVIQQLESKELSTVRAIQELRSGIKPA